MSKVLYNGSILSFRGKVGSLVFRQLPNGTTVVTQAPIKRTRRQKRRDKEKRSPRQKAHNSRFREAVDYARTAQVQPVYIQLAAATPMNTAYNFALSDWWHAPVIHCIERSEGRILVQATDDVQVAKVQVTIMDEDSKVLETGEAIRSEGDWWEFTTHITGMTIRAEAWDLPGHRTESIL